MSEEAQISLNPSKPSKLEFEVKIQGLDDMVPAVRFVLMNVGDNMNFSFVCEQTDEAHGWIAKLPTLTQITLDSVKFRVEVIVDGYYFEPASGELSFVRTPDVKMSKNKENRPTVTTSFKVHQDDPIKESSGGGEVTGQIAPTNQLLKPEFEPKTSASVTPVEDEYIDMDKIQPIANISDIASSVTPGTGNHDDSIDTSVFDPKQVAKDIVSRTVGKVERPNTKGSLFRRTSSGKALVPGLEDQETQQTQQSNAEKVKRILGSTE